MAVALLTEPVNLINSRASSTWGPKGWSFVGRVQVAGAAEGSSMLSRSCCCCHRVVLQKFSTFVSVTISLLVGAVVLTCIYGSDWHVASAVVSSPYRAFSADRISARVGVHIGLNSVNITLFGMPRYSKKEEINFNERLTWRRPTQVKEDYREALVKGLPFPILTIAEYFSQDMDGFCWGRRYRLAGHYAFIMLWTSLALWLLMNVLLCAIPRYGAYAMQLTGLTMLFSGGLYSSLLPARPLIIPFEGGLLHFSFGWCYWAVLGAGELLLIQYLFWLLSSIKRFSTEHFTCGLFLWSPLSRDSGHGMFFCGDWLDYYE
ncbi:hypothetical protein MRX96_030167 [Rhipicephalus microplus]